MNLNMLQTLLRDYRSTDRAFNQYLSNHSELDQVDGANVRMDNLGIYLEAFAQARYLLVGEAAGYAGCRFSGIPFTCEAQFGAGAAMFETGRRQLQWTHGKHLCVTSTNEKPWIERSATIVWEALDTRQDCVLWNAFPWHPFGDRGPLSNRAPGRDRWDGLEVLECFVQLFPDARPIAIGRVAQRALEKLGRNAEYIRHPSRGGKTRFLAGVNALARVDPADT